jgi:hypothetical protein
MNEWGIKILVQGSKLSYLITLGCRVAGIENLDHLKFLPLLVTTKQRRNLDGRNLLMIMLRWWNCPGRRQKITYSPCGDINDDLVQQDIYFVYIMYVTPYA